MIPKDEDRVSRDKGLSVYLTQEEHDKLMRIAKELGFDSKSRMMSYITVALIEGGFSGLTFMKLGYNFTKLIDESGTGVIEMPRFFRRKKGKSNDEK